MTDLTKGMSGQGHEDGNSGAAQGESAAPPTWAPPPGGVPGQAGPSYGQAPVPYGQPPAPYGYPPPGAFFVGKARGTGISILLFFVTFGIYGIVWYYMVHDEMKRHSGQGLGGGLALVLAILVGFVSPFFTSSEVGALYERRGQEKPVSGTTGLWYLPGMFILVGPFIWFAKTNGALNEYWASFGQTQS